MRELPIKCPVISTVSLDDLLEIQVETSIRQVESQAQRAEERSRSEDIMLQVFSIKTILKAM